MLIGFLEDNPVIDCFIVLVLLITVVPAGMALYRRHHPIPESARVVRKPGVSRFLGIQMDLAMLVLGLLLVLGLIGWLRRAFP